MQLILQVIFLFSLSQHFPSPEVMGSAVSAWSCGLIILIEHRMLVREPVHGMQGVLEKLMDSDNDLNHDVLSAPHAKI